MDGRIDPRRLLEALDAQRQAREMSWRQLAHEANVSPSLLSRMRNKQRPDLDGFVALVQWLGMPAEDFMAKPDQEAARREDPEFETEFALLLRSRKDLSETDKRYLKDIVEATVRRIRATDNEG